MRSLTRVLLLAVLATDGAVPGAALEEGLFGGPGPGDETEPNNRISNADLLGVMPAHDPLAMWGEIAHRYDLDVHRKLMALLVRRGRHPEAARRDETMRRRYRSTFGEDPPSEVDAK